MSLKAVGLAMAFVSMIGMILFSYLINTEPHRVFIQNFSISNMDVNGFDTLFIEQKTDVVMGIVQGFSNDSIGYGKKGLNRFIGSLFASGFDGHLFLALDDFEEANRTILHRYSRFKTTFLDLDEIRASSSELENAHILHLRYILYAKWSQLFQHPRTRIILTDVRDVYFQENPFSSIYWDGFRDESRLFLFEENNHSRIRDSSYNSKWIRGCFGKDVLIQVRDSPILCSGTTAGYPLYIQGYCRMMAKAMNLTQCQSHFSDQAFHNVLFYQGNFSAFHPEVVPQGNGPVATLGIEPSYHFYDHRLRTILNKDGVNAALIHQYDRYPQLERNIYFRILPKVSRYLKQTSVI